MNFNFFNMDKKRTDRGWEAMRTVLEREMPEPKQPRPWAFWLWLGVFQLAIAGAGLASWQFLLRHERAKEERGVAPADSVQLAGFQRATLFLENRSAFETLSVSSVLLNDLANNLLFSTYFRTITLPQIQAAAAETERKNTQARGFSFDPLQVPTLFANFKTTDNQAFTQKFDEKFPHASAWADARKYWAGLMLSDKMAHSRSLQENMLAVLPQVASLLASPTLFPPDKVYLGDFPAEKQDSKWKLPKKLSISVLAGLYATEAPSVNSYFGGFAVDWRFSNKVGLRTGIQYRYAQYTSRVSYAPVAEVDGREYFSATGDTSVLMKQSMPGSGANPSQFTYEPAQVYIPVTQQHRVEMPVAMYWQPFRAWRVTGGLVASRLVKASSEANGLAQFRNTTVEPEEQRRATVNNLVERYFPKWEINYQLGLGYKFSPRMEVSLSARNGFLPITGAGIRYIENRWRGDKTVVESISTWSKAPALQVSAAYRLH